MDLKPLYDKPPDELLLCTNPACRRWLAVIVEDGQALSFGGSGRIRWKVSLICNHCKKKHTWWPATAARKNAA